MLTYFIILIFLFLNTILIYVDIKERRIPNLLLVFLTLLIPIWYKIFNPIINDEIIVHYLVALLVLILGVFFYKESGFLGSGDLKYFSILLILLIDHSLIAFIGNIGVLTFIVLLFWWSMTIGVVYSFKENNMDIGISKLFTGLKQDIKNGLSIFLLDWIIVGYTLSLGIKDISQFLLQFVPKPGEYYFLLGLIIFLLRPGIRVILIKWKYKMYPIIGILIYLGMNVKKIGGNILIQDIINFLENIWIYAFIFTTLNYFTQKSFFMYDKIVLRYNIKNYLHSIPFSIILFISFYLTFFIHINILEYLR